MSIERAFDTEFVAELAAAEKQVQQSYRPVIGVHKWFARRPGTLFRALMLSELSPEPLAESFLTPQELDGRVLDPFMGGGTTLFEGSRMGLSVIGYDTNPMSRWVCERELEHIDVDALDRAGEAVCRAVEKRVADLYLTECEECGKHAPVKNFLWVKTHICECGREHLLFPGPRVAGRRMKRHTHEVLVCGVCREVNQFLPGAIPNQCPGCSAAYEDTKVRSSVDCDCGRDFKVPAKDPTAPPSHTLFALEYHCVDCKKREGRRGRFFKGATDDDHRRFARAAVKKQSMSSSYWPDDPIPSGDETDRLHRWGYRKFVELHNDRQLLGLALLAEEISGQPANLRPALATVFSDFIRYQNMVCRYDTAALKVLDIFSVHGFPVHRVQCEPALIGLPKIGSGGYRHFLAKYVAAKRYCDEPFETIRENGKKRRISMGGEQIGAQVVDDANELSGQTALLLCASIADDPVDADSVDLVLTDPPYFAMVQYSELMDFCYSWLRRLCPEPSFFTTKSAKSSAEVTGNTSQGRNLPAFAEALAGVYRAAARALKPGRPFCFTYHHNDLKSYAAVVAACLDAELVPITTLPCPSEMRGSVHISNSNSSRVDTVFVLRKPPAALPAETAGRSIEDLVDAQALHLTNAGLQVTEGDRRCLTYGLQAEEAMRQLAPEWDRSRSAVARLQLAKDALTEIDRARLAELASDATTGEQRAATA